MSRKTQRQLAEDVYRATMNDLALSRAGIQTIQHETIGFTVFADWFDRHHTEKRRGKVREREILKRLKAEFGSADLATITRPRVQEYITARLAQKVPRTTRTVSANTVNREVDLLKAMLREAVPTYLTENPLKGLKKLRVIEVRKRVLTPAEERRLLAELAPADRALFIVAVDTLVRLSNLLNLRWEDVRGKQLYVRDSKTGPYSVPLSTRASAALAGLTRKGPYCFPHRRKAKKERDWRGAVRLALRRACARCRPKVPYGRAVAGVTFHTATRATAATRMLRSGIDLRTVQEVGNWEDLRSVQRYLHTDARRTRQAVNRIGRDVTPT